MNRFIAILAAAAVLSGCATSQQQIDAHAPALNSWVGAPIDEFLYLQGDPTTVIDEVDYRVYRFAALKTKRHTKWGSSCAPKSEPDDQQQCERVVVHSQRIYVQVYL